MVQSQSPSQMVQQPLSHQLRQFKKSNPTVTDVNVGKGGTTAVIPANKADDKSKDADGVKDPSVTLVVDPSNLTEAEKAKVADEVKKSNQQ